MDGMTKKIFTIDVHTHLGPSLVLARSEIERGIKGTPAEVLKTMEKNAMDMAVVMPHPGYPRPDGIKDTMRINDLVAEAVKDYPEKFPCGLGTVEPLSGDKCLEEVDRIFKSLKLKGLSLETLIQGTTTDHPMVFRILERAAKNGKIVAFVETGQTNQESWRLGRLAEAFPEMTFINAHPGITMNDLESSLWLSKKFDNIFIDTCAWITYGFPFKKAVAAIGADRIVFGDDIPYIDISHDLVRVKLAEISDHDKELILWKNAAKIFNIER